MKCKNKVFKINKPIILTNVWPANIFAVNLIDKLNALIIYENISISINTGNNAIGQVGTKIFKNLKFLYNNPKRKIDKQIDNDNHIVTIKWLVNAIPKGIILIKFDNNIVINIVKTNGKKK